jgi:O-antigen/teichoic acid export membrane protein
VADTAALPAQPIESIAPPAILTPIARDAISYGTASLLFLAINAVCAFLVPRFVSVENYGVFKLFLLYGGYVGVLHFGSLDGALVRWAKQPETLVRSEFPTVLVTTLAVCTLTVSVAFSVWMLRGPGTGLWTIAVALVIFAIASNAITAVQFAMQAERRFRSLSALSILQPGIFLVGILLLKVQGPIVANHLLALYVTSAILALIANLVGMRGRVEWRWPSFASAARLSSVHIRSGIFILLSNLGLNLVLGLDRVFLSARFPLRDFAIYSFAASIFYSICLMIQAISKVVFPYVSQRTSSPEQRSSFLCAQRAVLAVWTIGLTAYFPAEWLVRELLPAYVGAIPVLRIALLGLGAAAIVQIVHCNYFRAYSGERKMLAGTCVGLLAFAVALWISASFHSLLAIAWAAATAHVTWWAANECLLWRNTDRTVGSSVRDFSTMIAAIALFLYFSEQPTIANAVLYLAISVAGLAFVLGPSTILTVVERYVFAGEVNS